jgi:tetratricopeptide (TPR) repeat protein
VSYLTYSNLPLVGELYYQKGQKQQTENRWSEARESYDRALKFIPDDLRISVALGNIYETFGDFDKAIAEYEKGKLVGDPASMNALGRVQVWQAWEKTHWMGQIDETTARHAELLFDRASRIADLQAQKDNVKLLQAEIRTNQGILHWAKVGWSSELQLLDKTWLFENAVILEEEALSSDPKLGLLSRPSKSECYNNLVPILGFAFKRAPAGIDPQVAYQDFQFSCFEIYQGPRPENLYDSRVIDSALSLDSVRKQLEELKTQIAPDKIKDSKLKQNLSSQIQKTQRNLDPKTLPEEKIILRVFVNQAGKVVRYYTYDKVSHGLAYTTPIEQLWWNDSQTPTANKPLAETNESLAEFKVTFAPSGKFEVALWDVPASSIDATDPAEMGALQSRLFEKINEAISKLNASGRLRADGVFNPSLVYRVSLTQDGAIADYQSLDKTSATRFPETPLSQLPKSNVTNLPLIQFKVEFKASNVFRITPWEDEGAN